MVTQDIVAAEEALATLFTRYVLVTSTIPKSASTPRPRMSRVWFVSMEGTPGKTPLASSVASGVRRVALLWPSVRCFVRSTCRWKPGNAEAQQEKKTATAAYCSLCPLLLQLTAARPCCDLLAPLLTLADRGPQFFRDQHQLLLRTVKGIVTNSVMPVCDSTRRMALQVAAEAFMGAPKFARKVRNVDLRSLSSLLFLYFGRLSLSYSCTSSLTEAIYALFVEPAVLKLSLPLCVGTAAVCWLAAHGPGECVSTDIG